MERPPALCSIHRILFWSFVKPRPSLSLSVGMLRVRNFQRTHAFEFAWLADSIMLRPGSTEPYSILSILSLTGARQPTFPCGFSRFSKGALGVVIPFVGYACAWLPPDEVTPSTDRKVDESSCHSSTSTN